MGKMLCVTATLTCPITAHSDAEKPDPDLLEFLGQTLELEELGVDVDKIIRERKKEKPDNTQKESGS